MISKIRQIISEKCRLSGIRGCMAAGAVTAGIAAFAVIGGANADDISTVSVETDAIPEETAAVQTEKKTYSRDMDLFFLEEMNSETDTEDASEEIAEGYAPDSSGVTEETEAPAEDYSYEDEESVTSSEDASEDSTEDAEKSDEPVAEEAASEETDPDESEKAISEEPAESDPDDITDENADSVTARSSAAGGDEDDGGLSSALDLDVDSEAAPEASSSEEPAEDASDESGSEGSDIAEMSDEASEQDEDLNDIPEDITLDEEDAKAAPQEGAISLFELPEWLSFDENGIPTEYVNVLSGKACAYTASPDALMSTGKTVFQGYVAVDPDVIPYGSELYIVAEDGEVYGYAIAADTGYSVRAGHIIVDLFMNEYDDCIQWGNKTVNVYVLR